MKLELIGGNYYVNSQPISKEALRTIIAEIWDEKTFKDIIKKIDRCGFVKIHWEDNKLVEINTAALDEERRKNQLLTAKLAAVELAFLGKSA